MQSNTIRSIWGLETLWGYNECLIEESVLEKGGIFDLISFPCRNKI